MQHFRNSHTSTLNWLYYAVALNQHWPPRLWDCTLTSHRSLQLQAQKFKHLTGAESPTPALFQILTENIRTKFLPGTVPQSKIVMTHLCNPTRNMNKPKGGATWTPHLKSVFQYAVTGFWSNSWPGQEWGNSHSLDDFWRNHCRNYGISLCLLGMARAMWCNCSYAKLPKYLAPNPMPLQWCNLEPPLRYIKVHFYYLCRTIALCSLSASGNLDPEVGDLNKSAVCCYILTEDRNLQFLNSLLPVQFVSHSPGSFWSPPALTVWKREGANNDGFGLCFRWDCDYARISCKWWLSL